MEVGKRVCVLGDAEIHCDARPNLPIFEEMQGLLERNLIVRYVAAVGLDTCEHERFIFRGQEGAVLWERRNDRPACHANEDRDAALYR